MPPIPPTPTFNVERQNSVICLLPCVRRYQGAIFVEQRCVTTIFIACKMQPNLATLRSRRLHRCWHKLGTPCKFSITTGTQRSRKFHSGWHTLPPLCIRTQSMIKGLNVDSSPIEIGMSKHCCHMCAMFIKEINKISRMQLLVSGLRGKAQPGWRFPPETPLYVQRAITKQARNEVDELGCYADTKGRSDSFPTRGFWR